MNADVVGLTNALMVCLVATVFLQIIWFIYRQVEFHIWNVPPGPIGVPILGYLPFMMRKPYKNFAYLNKTYGKLCSMRTWTRLFVVVSDYDTAKELLSHHAALDRPAHSFDFAPGKGGFAGMNGKQWALERRLALQALRNGGMGNELWGDIVLEEVQILLDTIAVQNGEPVYLHWPLRRAAMVCMLSLMVGRRRVAEMTEGQIQSMYEAFRAFKNLLQNTNNFIFLFPWTLKYLIWFNISGCAKDQKLLDGQQENLREMVTHLKFEDEESKDYFKEYEKEVKKRKGFEELDDASRECLIGNTAVFGAANEPAIVVLEWILYFMAACPNLQAKVQAEIDDAVGATGMIRWEDRQELPYTMACVLEMERWASVIPIPGPRCASETFQFHGYTIQKDTIILTSLWAINRDPKYWKHPDKYIPERFLEINAECHSTLGGFAPFSLGKRNCPGDKISLMMAFLFFARIMQKYIVRTPTGEHPDLDPLKYSGTLEPKNQRLSFLHRE